MAKNQNMLDMQFSHAGGSEEFHFLRVSFIGINVTSQEIICVNKMTALNKILFQNLGKLAEILHVWRSQPERITQRGRDLMRSNVYTGQK
jgi:hypothetical protein